MPVIHLLRLSIHEGRILKALWEKEELTVQNVVDHFDSSIITEKFVRANLEKLCNKNLVQYRRLHGTHYYRPLVDRDSFLKILRYELGDFLGPDGAGLVPLAAYGANVTADASLE